jgi:hypothetical protein
MLSMDSNQCQGNTLNHVQYCVIEEHYSFEARNKIEELIKKTSILHTQGPLAPLWFFLLQLLFGAEVFLPR